MFPGTICFPAHHSCAEASKMSMPSGVLLGFSSPSMSMRTGSHSGRPIGYAIITAPRTTSMASIRSLRVSGRFASTFFLLAAAAASSSAFEASPAPGGSERFRHVCRWGPCNTSGRGGGARCRPPPPGCPRRGPACPRGARGRTARDHRPPPARRTGWGKEREERVRVVVDGPGRRDVRKVAKIVLDRGGCSLARTFSRWIRSLGIRMSRALLDQLRHGDVHRGLVQELVLFGLALAVDDHHPRAASRVERLARRS